MKRSYGCFIEDWERLLAAVRASEAEFPAFTPFRVALEEHAETVKTLKARQLGLLAEYQATTRELRQMILAGQDKGRRLRNQVKADLGPRNPRLRLFGIAPLGKLRSYGRQPELVSLAPAAGGKA